MAFVKHVLLGALFCISTAATLSGQYGNEWIDFSKTYYKFQISEDGLYRIPQEVLASTALAAVPASQFRLYHLGFEVPIYTTSDGVFGSGDYIEFYGLKNRGETDRVLYQDPDAQQLNPRYSMFTDKSPYFLTWDDSGQGLRIMQVANDLSNPPAAETYYMHTDEWVYSESPIDPRINEKDNISFSRYSEAEGFGITGLKNFILDVTTSQVVQGGPDARLDVRFASSSVTSHFIDVSFGGESLMTGGSASNFHVYQLTKSISASLVGNNQQLNIVDSDSIGSFSVSVVKWAYPRQPDFTGQNTASFTLASSGAEQYYELQNFNHGDADPVVYDLTSRTRLIGERNGSTIRVVLPAYSGQRQIRVAAVSAISMVTELNARTFTDYSGDNTNYIIITHHSLREGGDAVNTYANYRRSAAGGNYSVGVYDINDLYDQFGYGIVKHPQAIRNFNRMIQDNWTSVKVALLIGKAVVYTSSRIAGSEQESRLLVPTFGKPGADNLLFTINGISKPPFPVGRLPVLSQDQLNIYLSKVMEHDAVEHLPQSLAERGWTKQILHLGGGSEASEQVAIVGWLDQMAANVINGEYGAEVTTFTKTSTNSTGQSNSDQLLQILHDGVGVVKFFGHSSASTLDFQINNPADWKNKGKYPIFSAMGCYAGDIHQSYQSLSENFIFTPDAGTIAFIAGSGPQYLNTLGTWGTYWYDAFGHGVNTMTLGESILAGLGGLNQFGTYQSVVLIEQQTIAGDPAIRYYQTPGPDYVWDYESMKFSPNIITTNEGSFRLSGDVVNIGTNLPDSARVTIRQKYPNGQIAEVYSEIVHVNGFRTHLEFALPIKRTASGLNTFYLDFDTQNTIAELPDPQAEQNNSLVNNQGSEGISLFILDNRAVATYPLEFAIVTESKPLLVASSTNAFIKGQDFIMEIDTTAEFNSPLKNTEHFSQFGGVIGWSPLINYVPGTVYYWRVSTESSSPDPEYLWDTSSFLYNPGGDRGWNQSHYYQFLRNAYDGLKLNSSRRFELGDTLKNIWVQNAVDQEGLETFKFFVNNTNNPIFFRDWKPYDANVFVVAFSPVHGFSFVNPVGGAYGAINPFSTARPVFPFSTSTPESREALMEFIENVIPDGYSVILFTYQRPGFLDYHPEQWAMDSVTYGRNIFSVIENIYPESEIRRLEQGSVPYTFMFTSGGDAIQEQIAIDIDATTNAEFNHFFLKTAGSATSPLVGPASKWSRVEWSYDEHESQDIFLLSVSAIRKDGTDSLIVDNVSSASPIDLTWLDAKSFPYLQLHLKSSDPSQSRTTPQLIEWRVLYEGRPEFVYNPTIGFEFERDSLQLGDSLYFMTGVENVSPYASDPFTVNYSITNPANEVHVLSDVVPALPPGGSAIIEFTQPITDNSGDHLFLAELNPDSLLDEVHHFNNFGLRKFYVIADESEPTLDVTFDGRHLEDGDVISSTPHVVITLVDDNTRLPISSRDNFELFLQTPQSFEFEKVDLNSNAVTFSASDPGQGIPFAVIEWNPELLEDGYYTFRAVGKDGSNNRTTAPYEINFEVLAEARILDLRVSPNPFRDVVRFSFVVTGHQPPSVFKITISDAAGHTIRVLDEDETGVIYVGSHQLDITWDGKSESGSLAPAGVYYYSIEAKDENGRDYRFDRLEGGSGGLVFMR